MALKVFKPITAGTRGRVDLRRDELTTNRPEKTLVSGRKSCAGRGAGAGGDRCSGWVSSSADELVGVVYACCGWVFSCSLPE